MAESKAGGMMIESSVAAVGQGLAQKENVVIRAGGCSVTLLPHFGGKIASIQVNGSELIHAPLNPYTERASTTSFGDSDAGGWDECIPSVAACTVSYPGGEASVPDHGDLWGIPWTVLESSSDAVTLRARCQSLPLELTRSSVLVAADGGWTLHLLYTLANVGETRVPWVWSAHPLFAVDSGDRLELPPEVSSVKVESSMGNRLPAGRASWPITASQSGEPIDLSLALEPDAGTGDKLFAGPLHDGWCTLERPGAGIRLTLRFDSSLIPYLGLWLCYGGWPERPGTKQVCMALEPTTASSDSLAEAGDSLRWLDPGESVSWPLEWHIEPLSLSSSNPAESIRQETTPAA